MPCGAGPVCGRHGSAFWRVAPLVESLCVTIRTPSWSLRGGPMPPRAGQVAQPPAHVSGLRPEGQAASRRQSRVDPGNLLGGELHHGFLILGYLLYGVRARCPRSKTKQGSHRVRRGLRLPIRGDLGRHESPEGTNQGRGSFCRPALSSWPGYWSVRGLPSSLRTSKGGSQPQSPNLGRRASMTRDAKKLKR
jgi:hypothetical protein